MNTPANRFTPLAIAETLAAAAVLAVGMGFGRFSYTGMYPLMVRDGLLSVSSGSLAASANYAGYLLGALIVSRMSVASSSSLCKAALCGTTLCLALLAFPLNSAFVIAIRLLAGVVSALALVAASVWLFHRVKHSHSAPLLFAGVGIGILISAELIALGNAFGLKSTSLWLALAAASAVLAAYAWPRLKSTPPETALQDSAPAIPSANQRASLGPWSLVVLYGLAGLGYIVTATYLPLLIKHALGPIDPIHIWAAFGIGAAPSCFLWHTLHLRFGTRRAIIGSLLAQAIGVLLPALSHTPLAYLASAILVGGTFMGTVTIAMHAAKRVADRVDFNIIAVMTAAYGVGQVVGPLLAQALFARTHGFDASLYAAGAALLIATLPAWFEFEPLRPYTPDLHTANVAKPPASH